MQRIPSKNATHYSRASMRRGIPQCYVLPQVHCNGSWAIFMVLIALFYVPTSSHVASSMLSMRKPLPLMLFAGVLPLIFLVTGKAIARDCSTYGNDAGTTAWMGCIEAVYINRSNRFRKSIYYTNNNTPDTAIIDCASNSVHWSDTGKTGRYSAGTIFRKACTDYN